MRGVLAAAIVAAGVVTAAAQYRTHNDRLDPPRFTSLDAWNIRAAYLREHILASAGLLPLPRRAALDPVVSGEISHEDYSVATVRFESLPSFYVTGNLYRPRGDGPFPAIVSPHGHWTNGRLENTDVASIPGRAINLARQGFVVFTYDMIGYGDSRQLTHTFGSSAEELWGLSLGGLQLWNSIRSLDFLETLPYVRKDGFGATGESGGGTQTFLLAAVDARVTVAAPVNMISLKMQGGCICENLPGLRLDTNNVELAATIAPRPMLMVSATGDWTSETLEREYPAIRAIYALFGAESKVHAVRMDAPHNYNKDSREAVYAWMARWMQNAPQDVQRRERPFTVDPDRALLVFPPGGRLPASAGTAESIVRRWIRDARDRVSERREVSPIDPELDAAFRHALGFGDAPEPPAVVNWPAPLPRVAVHAGSRADVARALRAAGFQVRAIAFSARHVGGPAIQHFATYNRSDASLMVSDIVAAMRANPSAVLVADGNYGPAALLAAAIVPIRRVVADVDRFDATDDQVFVRQLDIAGLRRAGDFTSAAWMARGGLVVHDAGDRFELPLGTVIKRPLNPSEIAARAAARDAVRIVEDTGCGIRFELPASWTAQVSPAPPHSDRGSCIVDLSPPDWLAVIEKSDTERDDYALTMSVTRGVLDEAACAKDIACRDGDEWYFGSRVLSDARHTTIAGGDVIVGRVAARAYAKGGGGYAGEAERRVAVVARDGLIARIVADQQFDGDEVLMRIVRSLTFPK